MERPKPKLGWLMLAVVALVASLAPAATLRDRARLREGPSKDTTLLGWLEEGTSVTVDGQRNGWYSVRTSDGRAGYVWQDHVRFDTGETSPAVAEAAPIATVSTSIPASSPPTTLVPEIHPPVTNEPVDGGAASDLQQLRGEVARLAAEQEELVRRLNRGGAGSSIPIASDGSAGAAVTFLLAGVLVGVIIGYFGRGRRERRSRIRL